MIHVDLNRTYPALFSLLGLTRDLAVDHFESHFEDPAILDELLLSPDFRERLDNRATWECLGRRWPLVEPHGPEELPCSRAAGDRYRSVIAPLGLGGGAVPVSALDLIWPTLRGHKPRLREVIVIEPVGIAEGLRPIRLPSGREFDLAAPGADLGRALIEEREIAKGLSDPLVARRREAFVKGLSVACTWGIFGRVDRLSAPRPEVR